MSSILARRLVCPFLAAVLLLTGAALSPAAAAGGGAVQVRRVAFSDWLAAQTTSLVVWSARENSKPNSALTNTGVVDYAGKLAAFRGLNYGFTADGNVSVRKYEDGSGSVLVNFNFENAITYVRDASSALIFGNTPAQLQSLGMAPSLSSGHFQVQYTVPDADNAPLDLFVVLFTPDATAQQIKFMSSGRGTCHAALGVPEGTPGQAIISQTGFTQHSGGALGDGFPVEHVDVHPAGRASVTDGTTSMSGSPAPSDAAAETGRSATTWGRLKKLYR